VEHADRGNDTIVITYLLGLNCEGKGAQFEKGSLFQLEAYVGALWLDANRLGMRLIILSKCVPTYIITNHTSAIVTFVDVTADLGWIPSRECQHNNGGLAIIKRFLVFHHMFEQAHLTNLLMSSIWT
jgi:hypothetical protein